MMAGCPYRYFLERILKIKALDELEYEPDTWLEAHQFGSMLHDVLETTMKELCETGAKPSLTFSARMKEIAADALAEWRADIPPPSESAFERRKTELLDSCDIFLRNEEAACGEVTPKHFELAFGPFPLPLGAGKSVMLRGRIDRVDHDEARDEWHVWDYKSGSTYQFERGGRLQCGTKIQHAIYARAVEEIVGGRVTKSGYFFPTPKGAGLRMPRECADQELKDALNMLFDTIRDGYFPHGGENACKFCDFQEICGGADRAAERTVRKTWGNASDPAVAAWLRLQDVK
jgi:ATP-dependent helicase/nuclease subunit B